MNRDREIVELRSQVQQLAREVARAPVRIGASGGGTNSTTVINTVNEAGCGCCNCLKCVNLCDLTVDDVVTECDQCPNGATKTYSATVADGTGWIEDGDIVLTHVDGGCVWETAEFDLTLDGVTGAYKWVLTQAGAGSTLVLTHVGGYMDVVGVAITYTATTTSGQAWSCVCRSKMELTTDREQIPFDSGLVCEVCLKPQEVAGTCPSSCECARCECAANRTWDTTIDQLTSAESPTPTVDVTNQRITLLPTWLVYPYSLTPQSCVWAYDSPPRTPDDYVGVWGIILYMSSSSPNGWKAAIYSYYDAYPCGTQICYIPRAEYELEDGGSACDSGSKTLTRTYLASGYTAPATLTFDLAGTCATPSTGLNYVNPNGCTKPGGAACGACRWAWCEDDSLPFLGGTCTGFTGQWLQILDPPVCDETGTCDCPYPSRDGTYQGEIITVDCTGAPA